MPQPLAVEVRVPICMSLSRLYTPRRAPGQFKHAVARRSDAFEQLKNLMVGTKAQLWRYEVLRNNYARSQRGLRRDLEQWLPEMLELPDAIQESIDAIASFEMWQRLRSEQNLSEEQSRAVVESLLGQLLIRS